MTTRDILRNICIFFLLFLNKLYEAIMKRKLQHSVSISKLTASGPLGHYTLLFTINTSEVKNRLSLKKVENVKSSYYENNL